MRLATAGSTAAFAAPYILGQNERTYRTALIGSGWWGKNILREAIASKRCNTKRVGVTGVFTPPVTG